ncbi:MAG: HNH endonuclease [Bacteroidota bacterium]
MLNQNYEPLSICNVKKAVVLLLLDKAEVVLTSETRVLRSISRIIPLPSVVRLSMYIRLPYKKIILSRKNILRRDNHQCQYCGKSHSVLTVDHILPKSRSGEETWENLVCACVGCNNHKGDRTPDEARMHLLRRPSKPNHVTFLRQFVSKIDDGWKPYLFMH